MGRRAEKVAHQTRGQLARNSRAFFTPFVDGVAPFGSLGALKTRLCLIGIIYKVVFFPPHTESGRGRDKDRERGRQLCRLIDRKETAAK